MANDDEETNGDNEPATTDIPEVDAEIVEEDPSISDAPFDDVTPTAEAGATKRSLVSPGVLFFAGMVIVAIAAGAVWYFTTGVYSNTRNDTPAAPASNVENAEVESAPPDNDEDKLVNNADVKEVLQSAPTTPPADGDPRFPEPDETIENAGLQAAAKEAATNVDDDASIEDAEGAAPPISFELDETSTEQNVETSEEPQQEAADTAPSGNNIQQTDEVETDAEIDAAQIEDTTEEEALSEPDVATDVNDNDINADARQRMEAFETSIESLQNELAEANDALSESRTRLAAAEDEIATLRADKAALEAENAALKDATRQSPAVAGAVAVNAIQAAVETGAPFAAELAIIEETAPRANAIATLRPYADGGAPAMAVIRNEFAAAARAGLATANRENADGLMERYGARVAGLFNLRPASPQPGASPGAVISRAEYAVDQGDLDAAIAEIETLPAPAQDAMGDWIDLARNRAQINAALTALNAAFAEQAARSESL